MSSVPLQTLRTFVEVGQRGSIKAAAQALHVTPGAISQQIRLLEDRVGLALFTRERQGLRLTPAGATLHPALLQAFAQIDQAMAALEASKGQHTLTISTVATFAASWLVPRLGAFKQLHPGIEIRVEATSALTDLRRDRVDVALRHGLGDYPGLESVRLMAPVLVPVAVRNWSRRARSANPPTAWITRYCMTPDRADWPLWLAASGVAADARAERGNAFEDDFLLIRAAESGQGLALVPQQYAQQEIAAGRLAQVLDKPWPARFAYYAVTVPGAAERPEVRAFLDWIIDAAAGTA